MPWIKINKETKAKLYLLQEIKGRKMTVHQLSNSLLNEMLDVLIKSK